MHYYHRSFDICQKPRTYALFCTHLTCGREWGAEGHCRLAGVFFAEGGVQKADRADPAAIQKQIQRGVLTSHRKGSVLSFVGIVRLAEGRSQ